MIAGPFGAAQRRSQIPHYASRIKKPSSDQTADEHRIENVLHSTIEDKAKWLSQASTLSHTEYFSLVRQ
jgi:hypothetical protein